MSNRLICMQGDKSLRMHTQLVSNATLKNVQQVIDDIIDTMIVNNLTHLSAPQINENLQIFVISDECLDSIDTNIIELISSTKTSKKFWCIINPDIIQMPDIQYHLDDCISCNIRPLLIPRHKLVTLSYYDTLLQNRSISLDYPLSSIIEHNVDHLNGILYIDHATSIQREKIRKDRHRAQKILRNERKLEIQKTILEKQGPGALRMFQMRNNGKLRKKGK